MPIDIYDKEFQNWLKGVFGLNTTRNALCEHIFDKLDEDLKDIPPSELKQFFICLNLNGISRLRTQRKGGKQWGCSHDKCKILMERFVNNHEQKNVLKLKWKETTLSESIGKLNPENQAEDFNWKVMKLYMHLDKDEAIEHYTSLKCLDISRVIKTMRSCKLFFPDGSLEPYDKVLESRNKLMHSPDNIMKEEETQEIIKWSRVLLGCLDITEKTYYKDAIAELEDIEKKDFVIKYQSEESKKIIAKVLEAKIVADELHKSIDDDDQRRTSKRLQDMLKDIGGFGVTANKGLEYKPADYKSIVKTTIERKSLTIEQDQAECDEKSDDYKELEALKQNTEQFLQEVEEVINRPEPEEMVDKIDSLNKELESKKSEEIRLKTESAKTIENLHNKVKSLEKEKKEIENKVQQYKKENEILKEYTSMHEESLHQGEAHQFLQTIDTLSDDIANERGGNVSHHSQIKVDKYKKENETPKENTSMHDESCDELQSQLKTDTMPGDITNEKGGNVLHQSQTKSKCAENDIQQYLDGYPDQEDDLMREENYKFFMDEIPSRPNGDYIDTIHNEWWGDYKRLEDNRKYMQWLFPVRAKSCNRQAQELFPHEIKKICDCKEAQDRLLLSYKMMLDFYGMKLENEKDGTVVRSDNWEERFENLNRSKHNHNRITRILKCLGELGFEHLKKNLIKFILVEILETKTLVNLQESCFNYWIAILKDPSERAEMRVFYEQLTKNMSHSLT